VAARSRGTPNSAVRPATPRVTCSKPIFVVTTNPRNRPAIAALVAAIVILINWFTCLINHPADTKENKTSTPEDHAGQFERIARGDYDGTNYQETAQYLKPESKFGSLFRHVINSLFWISVRGASEALRFLAPPSFRSTAHEPRKFRMDSGPRPNWFGSPPCINRLTVATPRSSYRARLAVAIVRPE
jgi:hypothetical protein